MKITENDKPLTSPVLPLLIVISGPSGVGKDAVLNYLKSHEPGIKFVTTLTTRKKRPAEIDGKDYTFISVDEFENLLKNNELMEHANVYGNWYGVPKQQIRDALHSGKDCVVKVDVQGASTIRKLAPEGVFIFLMPPSLKELENRLKKRYTESGEQLKLRLDTARSEVKKVRQFDYVVINRNGALEEAIGEIRAIIRAEKCRVKQRHTSLRDLA
ncbi:MAG TPA: guanylate kinase [Dehalococcoidales bacterium]|nr:guanylate kinase [Dehalococcoidales bacterium]